MGEWVVVSDALLSSTPTLIWLQLGFGLAGAVTIVPLDFRGFKLVKDHSRTMQKGLSTIIHDYKAEICWSEQR